MTKKLLFITPMFPKSKENDAVLPFVTQFTEQFTNTTQIKVDVLSLMYPKSKAYQFDKITVYPVGSGFRKSFRILPYFVKAILIGIKLCKKNNYDGILCFWYRESAFVGRVLSKVFNLKQMVWMLGQDVKKDNKYIGLLKIPANQIIMASVQQRDIFHKNHKINIAKIANVAIITNRFPEFNNDKRSIDILGVGNLGVLKNFSLFIKIVADLKHDFPDIKAMIIGGDSGERENLLTEAEELGITDNIVLGGTLTHKKVLDYMNDSTILLHTSKFEGNSTVIQEALFSGCQVVSTIDIESDGIMETFYFNTQKEKLVERILFLLKNPKQANRTEKFKMTDTINVILDSFYQQKN